MTDADLTAEREKARRRRLRVNLTTPTNDTAGHRSPLGAMPAASTSRCRLGERVKRHLGGSRHPEALHERQLAQPHHGRPCISADARYSSAKQRDADSEAAPQHAGKASDAN